MPESSAFVRKNEIWRCSRCGLRVRLLEIPNYATLEELRAAILLNHNRLRERWKLPKCDASAGDIVFEHDPSLNECLEREVNNE